MTKPILLEGRSPPPDPGLGVHPEGFVGYEEAVTIPTLITVSVTDRGVGFRHALDSAATIPRAQLVETLAASHFFWPGPTREALHEAVAQFL